MEARMNKTTTSGTFPAYDIVILGAGYAGLIAALRLDQGKQALRIALINASDQFLERVRLQESIVTEIVPRIPSISTFLAGSNIEFICGTVASLDAERRIIRIGLSEKEQEIMFDQAIYALGSRVDVESVPGAAEHAYRLEAVDGPRSPSALRNRLRDNAGRPLRVITVGGAETAVEVAGEIKTAWPEIEMTMISSSRCGDIKGARVESAIRGQLSRLGVKMIDGATVAEVRPADLVTSDGRRIAFDICVWSGGLRSPPVASRAGLATDPHGRIWVDPSLRSISHPHIIAVGDAAHPMAPTGAPYRLSAFAAITTGAYAADVILARATKREVKPFSFSTFGQGIAIGRGGVGFPSYPDDKQRWFILTGQTARTVRNFFVWFISYALMLERRMPGFLFWPGRRRVSWHQANEAVQRIHGAQKVRAA
jgi:NADH dehydrogenase FAD-containing subunit